MSLSPPPRAPIDDDKRVSSDQHVVVADKGAANITKPGEAKTDQDYLHPSFTGGIRAPSPDNLSIISIDDSNNVRIGRRPDYLPLPEELSNGQHSPALPPTELKGKIVAFWLKNKGLALVLIAQVFGTLMNVTTRLLEVEGNLGKGLHPFQILFARMSITVVLASLYMWRTKTEHFPFGLKEVRPLLVARGLGGFFGVFGMYYSLLYLPLADATVITFLAPSLSCWVCSYLIKEPFTRMEQIAAYISLFGVVLIARPTSLFTRSSPDAPPASGSGDATPIGNATTPNHHFAADYDAVTPAQRAGAVGMAMIGVFGAVCAFTTLRWIGKRAHPLISVNYFAVWCTIVSIVMMLTLPGVGFLLPKAPKEWLYLIFLGICGFVMQFLLAAGLQYEKSSRATNMVYTQMLFALAFDKLIWGTTPGTLSIIGSGLILGSAIYVAMRKEDPNKDGDERRRADRHEEMGLMSPEIAAEEAEAGVGGAGVPMQSLRV